MNIITDDGECIRILIDEGLLDKFRSEPNANMGMTFFQREDCWCMAVKHWGWADQSDNGYVITMLDKARFTQLEAARFFLEAVLGSKTEGAPMFQTEFEVAPLSNC